MDIVKESETSFDSPQENLKQVGNVCHKLHEYVT